MLMIPARKFAVLILYPQPVHSPSLPLGNFFFFLGFIHLDLFLEVMDSMQIIIIQVVGNLEPLGLNLYSLFLSLLLFKFYFTTCNPICIQHTHTYTHIGGLSEILVKNLSWPIFNLTSSLCILYYELFI